MTMEETMVCTICGRELPLSGFYKVPGKRVNGEIEFKYIRKCRECIRERRKLKKYIQETRIVTNNTVEKKEEVVRSCKNNCTNYPCFKGIDNMSSNLSLTCIHFTNKEL